MGQFREPFAKSNLSRPDFRFLVHLWHYDGRMIQSAFYMTFAGPVHESIYSLPPYLPHIFQPFLLIGVVYVKV